MASIVPLRPHRPEVGHGVIQLATAAQEPMSRPEPSWRASRISMIAGPDRAMAPGVAASSSWAYVQRKLQWSKGVHRLERVS